MIEITFAQTAFLHEFLQNCADSRILYVVALL